MSIEATIKKMLSDSAAKRSATQMTLGELIVRLQSMDGSTRIFGVGAGLASYRGYYSDLAFPPAPENESVTAAELLGACQDAVGQVFEGYKGGEYVMTKTTPLFISHWGTCSGTKIMALNDDGTFETKQDEY